MRFRTAIAVTFAGGAALAARQAERTVEQRLTEKIQAAGAAHAFTVGRVSFSWWGPLRLERVAVTGPGGERVTVEDARIGWTFDGGRDPRAHVRALWLGGLRASHGPLVVEWPVADLEVLSWTAGAGEERLAFRQRRSGGTLDLRWQAEGATRAAAVALRRLDLSSARASWNSEAVLVPGTWTGRVGLAAAPGRLASDGTLAAEGVRVALPRSLALGDGGYGAPTPAALSWAIVREGTTLDVQRSTARLGGLELAGHGQVTGEAGARAVAMQVSARSDLRAALHTTALRLPAALPVGPDDRLGTASFDVAVQGPLDRPAELRIVPHLRYDSTPEVAEKLEFLRRPFRYRPAEAEGVVLDVRDGAPDFIPLAQVPPLFLRALLISEDAGFYGHPGVDVAEIPVAWATNVGRGGSVRGASTITQQLVKNLFLSKDKSYGRKLEEAALALLVDAAVPKSRILEIYLNVIEWGPSLYGITPAARHYFGKLPSELTPREIAFLVCVIPSPIRYHEAHAAGHVGPGMEQLMANLMAKLRSVDALSEDEYAQALAEPLSFRPEGAPATAASVD